MYQDYLRTIFYTFLVLFLTSNVSYSQKWSDQKSKFSENIEFRNIGPWRGGRSCTVVGVNQEPNTYYMGTTGGGIWKTINGGDRWNNISDGFFGGSIGAIGLSQSDPNVIYVGTGEHTLRGNVSSGHGLWKSTDEGDSWKFIGLDHSFHISRIRVHPNNPDIVYVAVLGNLYKNNQDRGAYKSINGGITWTKSLFISDKVGISDLIIDPNNPRRLYASSWMFRRTPYSFSSGGKGSEIWTSTDGGDNWTSIKKNKGLPEGIWGISAITISPVKKGRIWALIEHKEGGLFRSENYGKTWKKINSDRSLRQRAWYFTKLYADTKDEDLVYVLNVAYHKSKDGGKTFKKLRAKHADNHDLWIDPNDHTRLIIANDGGAQISNDGGANWTTYQNQPTAQFYRVTTDNYFPFRIYAAQQDNSAIRIDHRSDHSAISDKNWERTAGGESGYLAPDPKNHDIVYGGSYGGYLTRYNHKNNETRAVNVWPDNTIGNGAEAMKYRFNWNFPISFSIHDSNKIYVGSNHLHITTDEGDTWQVISPDLTRNDSAKLVSSGGPITQDNTSVEYYGTLQSFAESPIDQNILWVGSDDGLVHTSRDGGITWINVTPPTLPEWSLINSIEADPLDEKSCYLACTNYKSGDFTPYIYYTQDGGNSWQNRSKGIAQDHFVRVIRIDPNDSSIVYAGTENGLYISTNRGQQWSTFQHNLPIVPITDMKIHQDYLIIATQGRALWILDDLSYVRQINEMNMSNKVQLYQPKDAYRIKGRMSKNPKNQGTNHPNGLIVNYYLDSIYLKDSVQLRFLDNDMNEIRKFTSFAKDKIDQFTPEKGANSFNWNMRYSNAKKFDGMIMWWASLAGARILPGQYSVQFIHRQDTLQQIFKVILDPRIQTNMEDLKAKFHFIQINNQTITNAHETIIQIRDLRKQLTDFKTRIENHPSKPALDSMIQQIDSTMTDIEETLYQTKLKSGQDPINFPIKLTNKLGHLNALISNGEYAPTKSNLEVQKEFIRNINSELDKFKLIKSKQLPALNNKIKALQINALKIQKIN